jgi:hypothetical protein
MKGLCGAVGWCLVNAGRGDAAASLDLCGLYCGVFWDSPCVCVLEGNTIGTVYSLSKPMSPLEW